MFTFPDYLLICSHAQLSPSCYGQSQMETCTFANRHTHTHTHTHWHTKTDIHTDIQAHTHTATHTYTDSQQAHIFMIQTVFYLRSAGAVCLHPWRHLGGLSVRGDGHLGERVRPHLQRDAAGGLTEQLLAAKRRVPGQLNDSGGPLHQHFSPLG